jgi:hypothetical protein
LNQNKAPVVKTAVVVQIEGPRTKKRKTGKPDAHATSQHRPLQCNEDVLAATDNLPHTTTTRVTRSSFLGASLDLGARERALMKKEQDIKRKSELLDEQLSNVSKKEQKASDMIAKCDMKAAEATLGLLDDHFTCSLCYEVMAAPYSLHPLRCGHTFDAICILRWFFSKAHQACGGWHEYVACPICRSRLIVTPEPPRHEITFPFIPNRTADAAVKDLVGKLESSCSGFKRELGSSSEKGRMKVKKEDSDARPAGLDGWRSGGNLRKDWIKRDKQGRDEMAYLTTNWSKLHGQDFISIKARLQV